MEKKTMMSDKDLSWFLGVEDETENESTSQEATAVPERERSTSKQDTENTMHSEPARNAENATFETKGITTIGAQDEKENTRSLQASLSCADQVKQS